MKRALDMAKVEEAFKRAAHKAVHGTREERSGKFMPERDRAAATRDNSRQQDFASRKARGTS